MTQQPKSVSALVSDCTAKNGGIMILLGKWNSHLSPRKLLITGAAVALMIAVTFFTLIAAAKWEVTVNDNGNLTTLKTVKTTVGAALEEAGFALDEADIVLPSQDTPISEAEQIRILRAFDITFSDIDGEKVVRTAHTDVEAVLDQLGAALDENDEVEPALSEKTYAGMKISVARVEVNEVHEEVEIGYDVIEKESDELSKGIKKLVTGGENGLADVTYRVVTKNGVETDKEELSREVLREPVDRVVAVGTKEVAAPAVKLASRSSSSVDRSSSKVIICRATAYDGSYATLGKSNPKTALGRTPTVGTVAVDPKVIPLGTRLYIEAVDGSYVYGECFAGDTGGGIKGNRVDLFMASRSQALAFGSRQVRVYILN